MVTVAIKIVEVKLFITKYTGCPLGASRKDPFNQLKKAQKTSNWLERFVSIVCYIFSTEFWVVKKVKRLPGIVTNVSAVVAVKQLLKSIKIVRPS